MSQPSSTQPDGISGLLRDIRVLQLIGQLIFLVLIALAFLTLCNNVYSALASINRVPSFGFLDERAGFLPSAPEANFGDVFLIGLANTINVTIVGLILSTITGVLFGIFLLSSNLLLRTMARWYVEFLRNTPLLVQLFAIYNIAVLALPSINDAIVVQPAFVVSNRGVYFADVLITARGQVVVALTLLGILVAAGVWIRAGQIAVNTGRVLPRGVIAAAVIAGCAFAGLLLASAAQAPQTVTISGETQTYQQARDAGLLTRDARFAFSAALVEITAPERRGLRYVAGSELSPEYIALVLALVIHTSAFIAEVVRAGIQAVDKGQREAARALGLTYRQTLRLIVLPQALRIIIPPLGNQYLNLAKNSSLAIAISFADLFQVSFTTINQTGQTVSMFVLVMAAYLVMSVVISLIMNFLNRRSQLRMR